MADIVVDTYKLNQYAEQIAKVNSRIVKLDKRIEGLYFKVGLQGLANLTQADELTGFSWKLLRCQAYLQQTAEDFENAERLIMNEDPLNFSAVWADGLASSVVAGVGASISIQSALNGAISQFSASVEDVEDAADALSWIEGIYEQLPHEATHLLEVVLPDELIDAYILTSGLIQGDLTGEEVWDVVKNVCEDNPKVTAVLETIEYTFVKGIARSEEMERQVTEQILEGDILGAIFDGAEGFVDTIIGGSIEVLGDVAGNALDDFVEKTSFGRGLNMGLEYVTGILGFNDGDGYTYGGLLGRAAEGISDGIDTVTNFITDTTDVVTDAITDGVKAGWNWVKSWF